MMTDRRTFLHSCSVLALGALLPAPMRTVAPMHCMHAGPLGPHPTPRQGITAAKVLSKDDLSHDPALIPLFDGVREIPEIIDGIRCNCGCASAPGMYSLLSCYEGAAMAQYCPICQGQGRLATRLHKQGKSLDDIRVAVDAQFGG